MEVPKLWRVLDPSALLWNHFLLRLRDAEDMGGSTVPNVPRSADGRAVLEPWILKNEEGGTRAGDNRANAQ